MASVSFTLVTGREEVSTLLLHTHSTLLEVNFVYLDWIITLGREPCVVIFALSLSLSLVFSPSHSLLIISFFCLISKDLLRLLPFSVRYVQTLKLEKCKLKSLSQKFWVAYCFFLKTHLPHGKRPQISSFMHQCFIIWRCFILPFCIYYK